MIPGLLPTFLNGCEIKIWEWPGDKATCTYLQKHSGYSNHIFRLSQLHQCNHEIWPSRFSWKFIVVLQVVHQKYWFIYRLSDTRYYRIAPNFRGTKFLWIGLLQIFAEINFADQGFPLATPSTIYPQSQQRHARLLASRFWLNLV